MVRIGSWLYENGKGETALRKLIPISAINRRQCSVSLCPALLQEN
jgi:hypothetical protein